MKRLLLTVALGCLLAAVALMAGCSSTSPSATSSTTAAATASVSGASSASVGYTTISASEAKEMIDAGGVTVVDVRTQSEYEGGHIPGAVLVTLDTIKDAPPAALPDQDATLLVYCRTGVRSAQASAALVKLGYTHVYNMDGGITAWKFETVTGA